MDSSYSTLKCTLIQVSLLYLSKTNDSIQLDSSHVNFLRGVDDLNFQLLGTFTLLLTPWPTQSLNQILPKVLNRPGPHQSPSGSSFHNHPTLVQMCPQVQLCTLFLSDAADWFCPLSFSQHQSIMYNLSNFPKTSNWPLLQAVFGPSMAIDLKYLVPPTGGPTPQKRLSPQIHKRIFISLPFPQLPKLKKDARKEYFERQSFCIIQVLQSHFFYYFSKPFRHIGSRALPDKLYLMLWFQAGCEKWRPVMQYNLFYFLWFFTHLHYLV